MSRYQAIPIPAEEFVRDFPNTRGRPVSPLGALAFGPEPVAISERLARPDFEGMHVVMVLIDDADLYLALAIAPDETIAGYPPDYVKLQVTDWGGASVDEVRERVRRQGGPFWEGVVLPTGWRKDANR
jgi:hypothetical protein